MEGKKSRRMTRTSEAFPYEDNEDTFSQMAQRKYSRVTTGTNRSLGGFDDGASYTMSDRRISLSRR